MLAKQKHIPNQIRFTRRNNPLLQRIRFRVPNQSKLDNLTVFRHGSISL
jgi:hypothetical protein